MGQASGKAVVRQGSGMESRSEQDTEATLGIDFNVTPDDILGEVLKWVPAKDIVKSCVCVCRQWHDVINTQTFWKTKCILDLSYSEEVLNVLRVDDFRRLYFNNPYNRNLIVNPDASKGFNYWNVVWNGGDRWKVEVPTGCDSLSDYTEDPSMRDIKCWVTSYYSCAKEQVIDLVKRGISTYVLDSVRPNISVSEWYAARFDCGMKYKISVQLLHSKSDSVPIKEWTFEDTKPAGRVWFKACFTFTNYDTGVRFVRFYHEGQDTQFWKGWYGAKMTLSTVVVDPHHTAGPQDMRSAQEDTAGKTQQKYNKTPVNQTPLGPQFL